MKNLSIIKKLGYGTFGTVYLAKYNNIDCIYKIEKQTSTNGPNYNIGYWREIEFSTFTSKYPNFYMQLIGYNMIENCRHIQPEPNYVPNPKLKKILDVKKESTICSELLYTPVLENTIQHFFEKYIDLPILNKYMLSMIAQILYSLYLMHDAGYYHNDIRTNNIMSIKTDNLIIELDKYKISTYGSLIYIIDYGMITHIKKFPNSLDERINGPTDKFDDYIRLLNNCYVLVYIEDIFRKYIGVEDEIFKAYLKTIPEFKAQYKNIPWFYKDRKYTNILFKILCFVKNPPLFCNIYGINIKKEKNIPLYDKNLYLFIVYYINNINNPLKIIEYIEQLLKKIDN